MSRSYGSPETRHAHLGRRNAPRHAQSSDPQSGRSVAPQSCDRQAAASGVQGGCAVAGPYPAGARMRWWWHEGGHAGWLPWPSRVAAPHCRRESGAGTAAAEPARTRWCGVMGSRVLRVAWYRCRATFGRRWGGYLGLVLLIGLVGGIALGSAAAARRTESSFPVFLASTNPSDLSVQYRHLSYAGLPAFTQRGYPPSPGRAG